MLQEWEGAEAARGTYEKAHNAPVSHPVQLKKVARHKEVAVLMQGATGR